MKVAQNVTELIGNTPIIKLNKIDKNLPANIYAKCEFTNPTSSIKDRVAFNMLKQALANGTIKQTTHIIEPTSGNTGIALASICASLGLKLTLTMPESMSDERRKLIMAFKANIVLTPANEGMNGALNKANELVKQNKNSIILQQFTNKHNPEIHYNITANEILKDMDNKIDIFVSAVGTGGTISGIGKKFKEVLPNLKIIAVEPKTYPHQIQGIGAGFIPQTFDTNIYDKLFKVSDNDAINRAKQLAQEEGLLVGISSGASLEASIVEASKEENKNKNIITILCDTGERYLSTTLFTD